MHDIAERLNFVRETYGPRAVALAKGTGGGTSVSDAERWLSRFINRFGSPNWVSTTHVCNWHKDTGFTYTFGVELPTPDLAHSNAFLLWGHNPSSTSLILAHDIVAARKRGMKIVAVDPRRVGIPGQADVLLQVRPGTDGALALALIDVVITDKLYDEAFVRQWTNGSLLVRADSGTALTEADLTTDGSPQRFVAWDETTGAPVVYDPSVGSFEAQSVRPALLGERRSKNQRRQRNPLPADICRAGEACRALQPGGVRGDYLCARREGQASRAVACRESPRQYVYVQRRWAAYQCHANKPGHRGALRSSR